jgi:hypothetical protein
MGIVMNHFWGVRWRGIRHSDDAAVIQPVNGANAALVDHGGDVRRCDGLVDEG